MFIYFAPSEHNIKFDWIVENLYYNQHVAIGGKLLFFFGKKYKILDIPESISELIIKKGKKFRKMFERCDFCILLDHKYISIYKNKLYFISSNNHYDIMTRPKNIEKIKEIEALFLSNEFTKENKCKYFYREVIFMLANNYGFTFIYDGEKLTFLTALQNVVYVSRKGYYEENNFKIISSNKFWIEMNFNDARMLNNSLAYIVDTRGNVLCKTSLMR